MSEGDLCETCLRDRSSSWEVGDVMISVDSDSAEVRIFLMEEADHFVYALFYSSPQEERGIARDYLLFRWKDTDLSPHFFCDSALSWIRTRS